MKKTSSILGVWIYFILKPFIYLLLNNSKRSRIAIIYKDQILVVRARLSDGKWGLPGGGMRKDESALQSVIREVFEESGIDLKTHSITKVATYQHNYLIFKINYIFYKTVLSLKPQTNIVKKLEIGAIKWVKIKDVLQNGALYEDGTLQFLNKLKF